MRLLTSDAMQTQSADSDNEVWVATTAGELAVLAGAINESLEAIEDWEFRIRLGVSRDEASALRASINDILRAQPTTT